MSLALFLKTLISKGKFHECGIGKHNRRNMANRRYPIVLITFTLTPQNNWPTGKYLAEQMMGEEGKCIIIARSADTAIWAGDLPFDRWP